MPNINSSLLDNQPTIEFSGQRAKDILLLARYLWCKLSIQIKNLQNNNFEPIKSTLRFLEIEKKSDRFHNLPAIIAEIPIDDDTYELIKKTTNETIRIYFKIFDEIYYFDTQFEDEAELCDKIPVFSFNYPEKIHKICKRTSQRIKNLLPNELAPNMCFIRDISINGLSFFYTKDIPIEIDEQKKVELAIPLLEKIPTGFATTFYDLNLELIVTRSSLYKKYLLYGCRFKKIKTSQQLLIQNYLQIRKKEEEFFKKNQYYPKIALPPLEIKIS